MIIDAHAHIYDILCGYGPKGEFRPLGKGRGIWANGEVAQFFPAQYGDIGFLAETLLMLMDDGGIDHAVLLQGGNYGFHNHYAAETAKANPKQFTAAVTVDPYAAQATNILDHFIEEYGIHILKFEMSGSWGLRGYHPQLMPDSPIMHPLMNIAEQNGMSVLIDPGPVQDIEAESTALLHLKELFPAVTFVLAHCLFPKGDGQNGLRLRQLERLARAGWMFDISNYLCLWHLSYTSKEALDYLEGVKQAVTTHRMIWGSDVPGVLSERSYSDMVAALTESGRFTAGELASIMYGNAAKAYRIKL